MTNWKEYRLGDLMEIKYGKDHKHLANGSFPLYGSGGIMRFVEKPLYDDETILIPRKGTLTNLFYLNQPFWAVDTIFWSKINKKITLPKYLFYKLKTIDLASLNVGSAVPSLTTQVLNEVLVSIPNLETQTAIAEILSSLDNKIELNNQINQNLEALAQAFFKQWFVDFEFPDKKGNPYKSSGGEMVESELGEIPDGWRAGKLGELSKVVNGYAFKSSDFQELGNNGILKIRNVNGSIVDIKNTQFVSDKIASKVQQKFKVQSGNVLIAMTGAEVGKIGVVPKTEKSLWLNQRVGRFEPVNPNSIVFINTLFNFLNFTQEVRNIAMGSAQPNISSNGIESIKCLIPNQNIIDLFSSSLKDNYQMLLDNLYEKEQLEQLRDLILPKLISGELEVMAVKNQLTTA
jgi:type I restriction enzyme S subunit